MRVDRIRTNQTRRLPLLHPNRLGSSAGVILLGSHALKANTRKQKVIAKSSAEAELYAAALGASEAKTVQSKMCDLGFAVKPMLAIDAKPLSTFSTSRESWERNRSKHCLTLGYVNMDEENV